jgi:hypothetical protein
MRQRSACAPGIDFGGPMSTHCRRVTRSSSTAHGGRSLPSTVSTDFDRFA